MIQASSIRRLLSKRERWTKGYNARPYRHSPRFVPADDSSATCWCLRGAAIKVYGNPTRAPFREAWVRLSQAVETVSKGRQCDPVNFNDARRTRFEDIQKLLRLAKV